MTRSKSPRHTNWWGNKLQAPLPGRMNLVPQTVEQGPSLGGCRMAELCRPMGGVQGKTELEEQRVGIGRKVYKRAGCV